MAEALKTQFKETIERERAVGLFLLAILFGLIVGVGGNAIYDLFIKPYRNIQILAVAIVAGLTIGIIKELRYSDNRMSEMEKKIKGIEKGGEN